MMDARKGQLSDGCVQVFDLFWRMHATVPSGTDVHKGGRITQMRATHMTDVCNLLNDGCVQPP